MHGTYLSFQGVPLLFFVGKFVTRMVNTICCMYIKRGNNRYCGDFKTQH